ncbi:MAG: hypothetical protein GXO63_01980 [Candidatus Micrarchaeota archaeon]|nr:hypothetical protein [Candidatus Micrarchaeota archaeon]
MLERGIRNLNKELKINGFRLSEVIPNNGSLVYVYDRGEVKVAFDPYKGVYHVCNPHTTSDKEIIASQILEKYGLVSGWVPI